MYALVQAGSVVRTGDLPATYKRADGTSVSGYNSLSDAQVKLDGWLPLTENRPALTVGQVHGPPAYTIGANAVTADYPVVAEPVTETNRRTIKTGLAAIYADAATAQTTIATLLASASPGAGALTTAQLSTVVRALDTALRQVATIESGVIKRAVGLVKLATETLDDTSGTT